MLILFILSLSSADLPIHCTYKELLGNWTFTLNPSTFTASLSDPQTFCTHKQPNEVTNFEQDQVFSFESEFSITMTFEEPNYVYSADYGEGTWTMVYDEGFICQFPEKTFLNYFFYYPSGQGYTSDCSRTLIGWYSDAGVENLENWGCFYGSRLYGGKNSDSENLTPEISYSEYSWVEPEYASFLQTSSKIYDDYQDRVNHINSVQNLWKANLNPRFSGLTLLEISLELGIKASESLSQDLPVASADGQIDPEIDVSYLTKTDYDSLIYYMDYAPSSIPIEAFPKSWDWSDINGVSYITDKIRSQKGCGSCYASTTVAMLESRLKVLTNNEFQEYLSEQYLISCSFYTEGCDGGYPILLLKFIQEFGLISETCSPYVSIVTDCVSTCEQGSKVGVSDYYYVGGYYGATDEENMIKELRMKGPFIADFQPGMDFMFYEQGIYQSVENRESDEKISNDNMRDYNIDWEQVSHSVLLVGYGEENGIKFWKLLNSWGSDWGEGGFFRIKRGDDECAIESMGEAALPYVLDFN